jgi:hypothetical protein
MVNARLKKDKRGFLMRTWVISSILFVTLFSLFYVGFSDMANEYDSNDLVDSNYNTNYNKYDELIESDGESYSDIFESMTDGSGFDILDTIVGLPKVFLKTTKLALSSVGIMSGVADDFSQDFGIPEEVSNIIWGSIIVIISIMLIFAIISSVSRSNRI